MTWSWILTEAIASPQIHKVVISIFHMVQIIPNMNVVSPQPAAISGLGRSNIFAKKRMPMQGSLLAFEITCSVFCSIHIVLFVNTPVLTRLWLKQALVFTDNMHLTTKSSQCYLQKPEQTLHRHSSL